VDPLRPRGTTNKGRQSIGTGVGFELTNLLELEEMARAKVPRATFDYIAGGAEDEISLRRNREAFGRWALRPRVLTDVSKRDTRTVLLGTRVSMPVCVAPTSFHALVHAEGEVATARGTAAAETILIASTISTTPLEEIAAAVDAPRWFQLYVYKDRAVTEELVHRAVKAGYKALCLTADTPVLGRRERDERNAFTLPPGFGVANLRPAGLDGMPEVDHGSAFAQYVANLLDASLTWEDVDWLRSVSPLPLVVKGIMTAEDAVLAVEHGVAGIVVSNHGGRQLDSTLGSLDALPDIVAAVQGRIEVYLDGGIRRGTDVLKALALGAKAVLVGRPVLWGLALGGADGVRAVLEQLRTELDTAMALAGRATVKEIDASLVLRTP
jgi:4-hydroxymandelate oxidase